MNATLARHASGPEMATCPFAWYPSTSRLASQAAAWESALAGAGERGGRIRAVDWSVTPHGPIDQWLANLRDVLISSLRSRFQVTLYWGPHLILRDKDADRDGLGTVSPYALGRLAAEVPDVVVDLGGPMFHGVMATGAVTWSVDQPPQLNRHSFLEESFSTCSCKPIHERGGIGVLLATTETAQCVLAERRLRTLHELAAEIAKARSVDEACARAVGGLTGNPSDLPFFLLYLLEGDGPPRLCAATGVGQVPEPDRLPSRVFTFTLEGEIAVARRQVKAAGELVVRDTGVGIPEKELPQLFEHFHQVLLESITHVHAEAERIRGIRRKDQIGKSQWATFPATWGPVLEFERCRGVAEKEVVRVDSYYEPWDEWLYVRAYPSKDGGLSVFYHDSTALKRPESAGHKACDEMELDVGGRTRKLPRAKARLPKHIARQRRGKDASMELRQRLVRAQEEEHRRIARELHDDLTQRLAVLAIDAGNLEQMPGCGEDVSRRARDMRERLVALSESVHSLARQLHPAILDDLGLADALRSECLSLGQRDGIMVEFHAHDVPTDLPREVALCFYRVAQEALRNVAHHARCRRASVRLFANERELVLCVRDQGVGFDFARTGKAGLGLESIRERASLIQARLKIRSQPGGGTKVTLRAPLQERS